MQVFEQELVEDAGEYVVTLLRETPLQRPLLVGGRIVLEPGAPVVWFTYPDRWYDIGRFHLRSGAFTGIYANVLTPVVRAGERWETTDLFLDVWRGTDGRVEILDEAELAEAVRLGWLESSTAARAREQAVALAAAAREGSWPPAHVEEWTLERAAARLEELRGG